MKKLVIIGGGIAGLAAAWYAQRLRRPVEITLVEARERLGGQIRTLVREGFRLEEGADSFSAHRRAGIELCTELGLAKRLRPQLPRPHHLYVRRNGALYPIPAQIAGMFLPARIEELADSPLLSQSAKRRLKAEASIPPLSGSSDESIAHFITRRMGPEVFQNLIEPIIDTLYAGDPARLSIEATLPYLKECEVRYGSLTRGLRRISEPAGGTTHLTFPGGLGEIVERLEARLRKVRILKSAPVVSIRRDGSGYRLMLANRQELVADAVISAAPASVAARLFEQIDRQVSSLLRAIPFASTSVVHLGYERGEVANRLDGYGYLIPNCEDTDLLACTWQTQRWRRRAPASHVLLRFYAGRYGRESITTRSDEILMRMAVEEAHAILGAHSPARLAHVVRWERAIPQYNVGHAQLMQEVEGRLSRLPGLFLAGGSYRGVSIPECIESGREAAQRACGA